MVARSGKYPVVVTHVGVNDIGRRRSRELVQKYQELLQCLKDTGRRCVVSGVLPRMGVGWEWTDSAREVNMIVGALCESIGIKFLDGWDNFYGRRHLYARDGLHLSREGVEMLSKLLEGAVEGLCQGN